MNAAFAAALTEWHDYFSAIAGVSGTLLGLLFVALGINPAIMADDSPAGLRVWSGQTFNSFLSVLLIGLAGLVPSEDGQALAITLGIVGVQGIVRVVFDLRQVSADHDPDWGLRQVITRFVSPSTAYVLCLWLAFRVWNLNSDALSWLIAIVFLLTLNAASSCWDLLKEIGVRHREKEDGGRKSEVGGRSA
jgi:hypothetical protein